MTDVLSAPVLVGRDRELETLHRRLAQVRESGATQVLVTGPRGAGCSSLVRRLVADHRAAGGRCLVARAVPWEREIRHGVLSQLVGKPVAATDALEAATILVEHVSRDANELPVLVVVDDASWSDAESLQALSTAVRHHPRASMLVVLAASDGTGGGASGAAQAGEAALALVPDRLHLGPLGAAEAQALARDAGVALGPTVAERLATFTDGRPGPMGALLAEVPREFWFEHDAEFPAPRSVVMDVRRRLAGLRPASLTLVEAVAVLGRTSLPVAARLAEVTDPLAAVDELVAAGLAVTVDRQDMTQVAAADEIVRAALLETMGRARTCALHLAAADVVDDSVRRLRHLVAASTLPDLQLADELEALATRRASTGEWAAVAELLSSSARLTIDVRQREDRSCRAFDALVGAGDIVAATARAAEVESLRETPLRNAALGHLAILRGRRAEAESLLARAWDLVNPERDPRTAALICQRHVLHALARSRGADIVLWVDRALALADAESPVAIEAAAIRGLGLAGLGQAGAALENHLRLEERIGHGAQGQRASMARGWLHLALDEVDEARAALRSSTTSDFLGGSSRVSLWAQAWLARTLFVSGEWDDALSAATEGGQLAERSGMRLLQPLAAWTRAQVHAMRGQWQEAAVAVREAESGPCDYEMMRAAGCLARAGVAEAKGDYADVIRALAPLAHARPEDAVNEPGPLPWTYIYANALVVDGRYEEADAFLRIHEPVALDRGHRSVRAGLASARGRLLGAEGNLPRASLAFEEAAALLADLSMPYDRARVHFAWGQTLRRAGKRREAGVVLKAARDLYEGLGATTYVERCDRELRAGGVRAPGPSAGDRGPTELTPQEELVAALVTRGMTNREVGAELFVSTKTVQYHLTRIYSKLGVRSRAELAALRGSATGPPAEE